MKNVINYYYNLYPLNIHQIDNVYHFKVNDEKYSFEPFTRPIEELASLFELNTQMVERNILVHEIILNKKKEALTFINEMPYILMKVFINENTKIELADIKFINNNSGKLHFNDIIKRNDWYNLWASKIDYFEYQLTQLGTNYPIIRETFSYYIGLAENALLYLKNLSNNEIPLVISHRRIKAKYTLYDFYHPCNLIIDSMTRDIAEYIKESVISNKDIKKELFELPFYHYLSPNDCVLLYARLLFPSYYFDLYELIIEGNLAEKEILKITEQHEEYEYFLIEFHDFLRKYANIPEIEWLRKKAVI